MLLDILENVKLKLEKSNSSNTSNGVSFTGLLAIVFIILKLCHVIEWSWLWVLAPVWIPAGLIILFIGFVLLLMIAFSK